MVISTVRFYRTSNYQCWPSAVILCFYYDGQGELAYLDNPRISSLPPHSSPLLPIHPCDALRLFNRWPTVDHSLTTRFLSLPLPSSPLLSHLSRGFILLNPQGKPSRLIRLSPAAAILVNSCTVLCKFLSIPKLCGGSRCVPCTHSSSSLSPAFLISLFALFHPISGFFLMIFSMASSSIRPLGYTGHLRFT